MTEQSPPEDAAELTTRSIVEAIVFSSDVPLSAEQIARVVGVGSARDIRDHIQQLNDTFASQQHAFRITLVAGGYRMLTLPAYNTWLSRLLRTRADTKLSNAALETLAIVAYKQPVLRAEIEAIRGVSVGDVLNRLREMGLVKITGRAEDLGRPLLYGTTRKFLEVFGLPNLEGLPQVEQLKAPA